VTHRKTEKERQFADGRGGKGAGVEPNHYDRKKARPSINRSILFDGLENGNRYVRLPIEAVRAF
jgi:hypothetical protein